MTITDSATIIGKVSLGEGAYMAQGTVLRSHGDNITMGNHSWALENSVLIGTPENPLKIGSKTIFGHKCIAIGAEIGHLCEIGNGVIFMPGCRIGNMCIFGEGTFIPMGMVIPDESVVVGRPARVIRKLTQEDKDMIKRMRNHDISLSPTIENIFENIPKEGETMGKLYSYKDKFPQISELAYLFDSAEITGDVTLGKNSIIGAGVKIIGDSHGPVTIGENVEIHENCVLHLLPDNELIIEDNVTIGPGCIIHGSTIGEGTIIEPGSIVCDYSNLGKNTLVKAGSLVKQRSIFKNNSILEGFPAIEIGKLEKSLEKPPWAFQKDRLTK